MIRSSKPTGKQYSNVNLKYINTFEINRKNKYLYTSSTTVVIRLARLGTGKHVHNIHTTKYAVVRIRVYSQNIKGEFC